MLGWPKLRKLAQAFLWEYSYKRLKLAQLLGQLGVFLTRVRPHCRFRNRASKVIGWPKICKLAHAFLWIYGQKRLKLAQHLGQLDIFLTCSAVLMQSSAAPITPQAIP